VSLSSSSSSTPPAGVRCALVGDQPLVEQCAEVARAHGLAVVLVATTNEIVRRWALEEGIPVVGPGAELAAGLDEHSADVLLSIANLRLIADDTLAKVRTAINFHDGPLPGYAGLNVTTWALLNGEQEHAITWHLMTSDVDGGEIVAAEHFPIAPNETAFSLNARCYEAALASFPRIAAALASGDLRTTPQPAGAHRMFMRHDRPAVLLDPAASAEDTVRAVRALDLGHWLRNTVGSVRLVLGDDVLVVDEASVAAKTAGAAPGSLVALDDAGARIATVGDDLVIAAASEADGTPATLADAFARHGITVGSTVPSPSPALADAIRELEPQLSRHEGFWLDRCIRAEPLELPLPGADRRTVAVDVPAGADEATILGAIVTWLHRVSGGDPVSFKLADARSREVVDRLAPLACAPVAVVPVGIGATFAETVAAARAEREQLARRLPLLRDAIGRDPALRGRWHGPTVSVELETDARDTPGDDVALRFHVGPAGLHVETPVDAADAGAIERLAAQLAALLAAGAAAPDTPVADLPLLGPSEVALLDAVNATEVDHDRTATLDRLFADQVARTPDAPALSVGSRTMSYAELDAAAAALAGRLAAAGVGPRDRVGIGVPRGVDMVVGVLATLRLGAAYLPLDPTYPAERLQFMVDDSGIRVLLATAATAAQLERPHLRLVDPTVPPDEPIAPVAGHRPDPSDLAYVIYTSGSTGKPKGVMLEHRQVVNFFVGMDAVIEHDHPGTWLAVTSLSFDISVLELLWTLTRGFHVVLKTDSPLAAAQAAPAVPEATRPVTFSLFYFAAGEDAASDGYRLLLESAKVADAHGFEAVWTPERHFHAFGGAYPNPSVTGAALAAVTSNVGIRAGSVVLPLHSPIRVAEEWAVVDNLSRGRVAISFAAGWQPNDFVLNPSAYANAKAELPRWMDLVQRLWRGETVAMPGHDGQPVDVRTLPRPVQPDLPVWLTSAGTPATFERAGTLGVNVLTHLLGQSVEQLAENVQRYRDAWHAAGHEGEGRVTLMLHTYLDADADTAREAAREPMKAYLGTAVGLLRDVASAFPTFANKGKDTDDLFKSLTPEELDQLLEVAAHRYLSTSGLFGTAADAAATVEQVSAAGVDEVACLIDFGVPTDDVLSSLDLLLEAKAMVDARRAPSSHGAAAASAEPAWTVPDTVAALVEHHGVTHLQCTPSLASMLVADPADRAALTGVQHLMLGGEALPTALARELRELLPGRFTNMYGPTETTIWSLTHELDVVPDGPIPIGKPLANQTVFVLDADGRRLPAGAFGELHIGGEGVARGYHERPELTAERFVDRPGMGRVYATGDVARIRPDGIVEFAGRSDNQVKIRGHRIELGEIESVIDQHPDVVQSVVVARDDRGDTRLVGFVVLHHGATATSDDLRQHVAAVLPDAMVPSVLRRLEALPLTPNGKIDRKALPADVGAIPTGVDGAGAHLADDTERLVASIWASELERTVGRDDNFFDIGGHSLLAVKVFRRLTDETSAALALTDVFRFPTVRTFAAHLSSLQGAAQVDGAPAPEPVAAAPTGTDRGAMRRRALARRGGSDGGT
jgi:natural product biosynthesis luciferase-like monooxygenase protein